MNRKDINTIIILISAIILYFLIPKIQIEGIFLNIILLLWIVIWFWSLIKWWDNLVKWGWSIAKKYNIPTIVIWLTIIALGSSAPEFFINVLASFRGESQLLISNIVGSNISNLLLIIWVTAIILNLKIKEDTIKKEIPFSFLAVLILLIFVNDSFLNWVSQNLLSRSEGLILLVFFIVYMTYVFNLLKKNKKNKQKKEDQNGIEEYPSIKSISYILIWIIGLYLWGELVVNNSVKLAQILWVSKTLIWVTIVALWTSLPELAAWISAAMKKQTDMIIWNVIWSNIFNIFWIGWCSATINSIKFEEQLNTDIILLLISTIIVLIGVYTGKTVTKKEGILFLILYLMYIIYVIFRG